MTNENDQLEDLEAINADEVMGSGSAARPDVHVESYDLGGSLEGEPGEGRGDLRSVTAPTERKVRKILGTDRP